MGADTAPAAIAVRRADRLATGDVAELAELLVACVNEGSSLGFHAPLDAGTARAWWQRFPRAGVLLLLAEQRGQIVGTVQMHDGESANGEHRGEVAKLLVHPAHRRQGVARALMTALETEARAAGKTLLHLDTREGDPGNALYAVLGYRAAGRIPNWARDANGALTATVFWYKALA